MGTLAGWDLIKNRRFPPGPVLALDGPADALPTTVIDSVGVYTTKRYRQPYTVYTEYNIYYILLVKDLPKVPGVAASMGFEPTTFRSKGIESTNVPTRPRILIGNCKKNIK